MATAPLTVLVVGATGSIGRLVVAESIARGHTTRALVRDAAKARRQLPAEAQLAVADVTRPKTLPPAVADVDAVVLTLGSDGTAHSSPENADYAGVRDILAALSGQTPRIVLMTAIGVTARGSAYDHLLDWKRRSERLVRASGLPYTVVRPGWFDMNAPDEHRLVFLQGDTRRSGTPSDGVIARERIAQVLVQAVTAPQARGRTFELVAEQGPAPGDMGPLFAALDQDAPGALDAVRDQANMPRRRSRNASAPTSTPSGHPRRPARRDPRRRRTDNHRTGKDHMRATLMSIGVVRPGGTISRVGAPQYGEVPLGFPEFMNNITLTGGVAPARAYIEELLPDVLEGRIEPGRVFDHTVGLDEVPAGYRAMADREALKVLVKP
ncbi:NAD(P)H-binding protein [Streptomyces sp. Ag109_G2-15]|uniref:NAD(P)H-binding protein n=1 Tax=Streptomyces sp. Ag109_G2-15 TaxID=1938850 RepID=UPI000BC7130C|nr:NAD(P)H-binding protein [Streptomyces sp. Ag109_G2-15]SOE07375.1 Uncharacterized conserved protein YbjT, contains NAD(P)-binding and DUF2867 domains [Streptomyces sp. Ag109_G2-15]